jgi:hypothetical protein
MTIYIGHERCSRHLFGCPTVGRWALVGLDPERPCGPLWRRLPYSVERAMTRIDPELGRQVVVKVEVGASRRLRKALAS